MNEAMMKMQLSGSEASQRQIEVGKRKLEDLKRGFQGKDMSPEARDKRLREACEGFESVFINKLWTQMRKSIPKEGFLHGKDEEMYLGMFDQEISKKLASSGGIGIGDMLYRQLKQELNTASRVSAPSRMTEPLPVRDLKPSELPDRPQFDDSPENMYEPVDEFQPGGTSPDGVELDENELIPAAGPDSGASISGGADNATAPAQDGVSLTGAGVSVDESADRSAPLRKHTEAGAAAAVAASAEKGVPASPPSEEQVKTEVTRLARRIEQQQGAALGTGGLSSLAKPGTGVPEGPIPPMAWPVPGRLSSGFGWRDDPFTGRRAWHAGVDIAASEGSPVTSCWEGEVIFSGKKGGYGNLVVVEHAGGWRSYYGHNAENSVEVGDKIKAGEQIASVGNTGRSTGPHLHFELRQGDKAWNPLQIRRRLLAGLPIGSNA